MSGQSYVQAFALKKKSESEKFGFSVKPVINKEDSIKYLMITNITPGSPADRAGLKTEMIVVEINNVPLVSETAQNAASAIKLTEPGKPLMVGIKVDGLRKSLCKPMPAVPTSPVFPQTPSTPSPKPPKALPRQSTSRSSAAIDTAEAIILDNGAWQCKVGLANQTAPTLFPTIAGRHRHIGGIIGGPQSNAPSFLGKSAFAKKGILKLTYPYERGIVKDWDDMALLWKYAFKDELRLEPKDRPILITEPIFVGKEQREKAAEILFEKFEVSSVNFSLAPLLGMYAANGHNSTIVVDIGDSLTQILPVLGNNNVAFMAAQKYSLAGRDVSERLAQMISGECGHTFTALDANLRDIKEKLGAVAENSQTADNDRPKEKFTLPDGNVIEVGNERFKCTELLFDPASLGMSSLKSIQQAVIDAASKCGDEAETLLKNIVICGGSTMFPGFGDRLEREIKTLAAQSFGRPMEVGVSKKTNGNLSAWKGGAYIAQTLEFSNQWILRKEYQESGATAVHGKSAPL